jgi:Subtilase family
MKRFLSQSVQIVLCAGLALGSAQEAALAQPLFKGAKTKPNSLPSGGRNWFYGTPKLEGPLGLRPQTLGAGVPEETSVARFHGWSRPVSGSGWIYRGPRFGGVPRGVGGMAGPIFVAGAMPAANSANAEQASRPPWRRPRHPAAERAPAHAPPSAKAIAYAPPPTPARTIVHAAPPSPPIPRLTSTAHLPPPAETRFRPGEVLVATAPGIPREAIDSILRRHRLAEADATTIALTGQLLRLWRFPTSRPVPGVVRELGEEIALASIQPNYIYAPEGDAVKAAPPAEEYWLAKLDLDQPLDIAGPQPVRVALIDTAIDKSHPDLKGSIEDQYDAISEGGGTYTSAHGTSMAGAIAAHGWLKGVAPTVRILSVRALDRDDHGLELGSTQSVMKAIQWAFDHGARILNMSFAGPVEDPALHDELASAHAKGVVLVGAAGNDGPKAAPRYPAADENVVAVTATDASDAVYAMANAGSYIAIAAPGVDVLLTAPNGGYAMQTGTSVSAALVSGVAALLIERSPSAKPTDVRAWLATTARPLALPAAKKAVGAGLVNARGAADAAARSAEPAVAGAKPPGS